MFERYTIVRYLIKHGADINEILNDNHIVSMLACGYNEENKKMKI